MFDHGTDFDIIKIYWLAEIVVFFKTYFNHQQICFYKIKGADDDNSIKQHHLINITKPKRQKRSIID